MAFVKGTSGNPRGRPRGVPNKLTKQIKEQIEAALESAGGAEYLTRRAKDKRTMAAFLQLVGKAMPLQIAGTAPDGGYAEKVTFAVVRDAD